MINFVMNLKTWFFFFSVPMMWIYNWISLSYKFAFNLEFMDIIIYIKTRGLYIIFCAIQHFQYIFIEFYIKNEKHKGNMHAEETL